MECQIILRNELHEKYILDRLDDLEKAEYEAHLDYCKTCKTELEEQQALITGVREAAKNKMKAEIRRQVEIREINPPGIDWATVSKIAAVLFIFVLAPPMIYYLQKNEPQMVPMSEPQFQVLNVPPRPKPELPTDENVEGQKPALMKAVPLTKNINRKEDFGLKESKQAKTLTEREKQTAGIPSEIEVSELGESNFPIVEFELAPTLAKKDIQPGQSEFKASAEAEESLPLGLPSNRNRIYVYEAPKAGLGVFLRDKRISKLRKSKLPTISDFRFTSSRYSADVHLKASSDELANKAVTEEEDTKLPKSFPVEITAQDSLNFKMTWLVVSSLLEVRPEEIRLELTPDGIVLVFIKEQIYLIDLRKKSTQAVLVE